MDISKSLNHLPITELLSNQLLKIPDLNHSRNPTPPTNIPVIKTTADDGKSITPTDDGTERFLIGSNDKFFRPGTEPKTSALPEKYFFTSAMPDFSLYPPRDEFLAPELDLDSYGGRGIIKIPKEKDVKNGNNSGKSRKNKKKRAKNLKNEKYSKKPVKTEKNLKRTIGDLVTPGGPKKGDFFYKKGSVEAKNRRFLSRLDELGSASSSNDESHSSSTYSSSSSCSSCSRCHSRRRRHHRRNDRHHHRRRHSRRSCSQLARGRRRGVSLSLSKNKQLTFSSRRDFARLREDSSVGGRDREPWPRERQDFSLERPNVSLERRGGDERRSGCSLWGDRSSFRDRAGGWIRADRAYFERGGDRMFRDGNLGAGRDENRGGGVGFATAFRNLTWTPRFSKGDGIVDSKYAGIADFKKNDDAEVKNGPPDLVWKRVERNSVIV